MTQSAFDPAMFGPYHYTAAPQMLHFAYDGSEDVYRYVLAEVIPASGINPTTRRKPNEPIEESEVRKKYIDGPEQERKN